MKNICIVYLTVFLCCACNLNDIDKNKIIISENSIVIDVRTEQEYSTGHVKNALNIPYDTIQAVINRHVPDKNAEIILYCRSGRRSGIAKKTLTAMGYKNIINAGAYKKLEKDYGEN